MVCENCKKEIVIEGRVFELTNNLYAKLGLSGKLYLYQVEAVYLCRVECLVSYAVKLGIKYDLPISTTQRIVPGETT